MSTEYRTVTYNGLSNLKIRHTVLIQEETQITCTKKAGFYQVHIESKYLKYYWELNVNMFDTEKVGSLTCMEKNQVN